MGKPKKRRFVSTKECPWCGRKIAVRGFHVHEPVCRAKHENVKHPRDIHEFGDIPQNIINAFKSRYANQLRTMTPIGQARYMHKAFGIPWDKRKYKELQEV